MVSGAVIHASRHAHDVWAGDKSTSRLWLGEESSPQTSRQNQHRSVHRPICPLTASPRYHKPKDRNLSRQKTAPFCTSPDVSVIYNSTASRVNNPQQPSSTRSYKWRAQTPIKPSNPIKNPVLQQSLSWNPANGLPGKESKVCRRFSTPSLNPKTSMQRAGRSELRVRLIERDSRIHMVGIWLFSGVRWLRGLGG